MHTIFTTRKLSLFVTLLFFSLLITHCGRGQEALQQAQEPAGLLWVTFDVNSQVEQTLVENYRADHPEITFNRQPNSFNQDYLAGPPLPDMLMFFANREYVQASRDGKLADLSEVWTEAALDEKVLPTIQRLIRDDENGAPLMVPAAFTWAGIYYNKAIFAQYNLQTPQTWDEFIQICAILQANGEIPLAIAGSQGYAHTLWFDYLNLRINGAEYQRALLEGKERFDDPRLSNVLETWRSLFEQGFVVEYPERMDELAAIHALVRRDDGLLGGEKAVMALMDTVLLSQAQPEFREELDFFRFPTIDPSIPPAELADVIGYVVPADAEHSVEAQAFLTYLGSPQAQELFAREAAVINVVFAPVRTDLDPSALSPGMGKAISIMQEAAGVAPFSFQRMPNELWIDFNSGLRQLLRRDDGLNNINSFMSTVEAARQNAIEEGVFE